MRYADVLRRVQLSEVSLRYNELKLLHLSTLLAAILSASRYSLQHIDLGCNRTMFVKGALENQVVSSLGFRTSTKKAFLARLGYKSSRLGEEALDAHTARRHSIEQREKAVEMQSLFDSISRNSEKALSARRFLFSGGSSRRMKSGDGNSDSDTDTEKPPTTLSKGKAQSCGDLLASAAVPKSTLNFYPPLDFIFIF